MLALVTAHSNFLDEATRSLGEYNPQLVALRANHVDQLSRSLAQLANTTSMTDATQAMEHVRNSSFPASDKTKLLNIVMGADTSLSTDSPTKAVVKPQENVFLHKYLTKGDWDVIRGSDFAFGVKIDTIVTRCFKIGLISLTEQTQKHLTATLIVGNGKSCALDEAYWQLKKVKDALKRMRHAVDTKEPSMATFPANVEAFLQAKPGYYAEDDLPIECPVDETMISQLRQAMPARNTHASLRQSVHNPAGFGAPYIHRATAGTAGCEQLMQLLAPLAQAMLQTASGQTGTVTLSGLGRQPTPPSLAVNDSPSPPQHAALALGDAAVGGDGAADDGAADDTPGKPKGVGEVLATVQAAIVGSRGNGKGGKGRGKGKGGKGRGKGKGVKGAEAKAKAKAGAKAKPKAKAKAAAGPGGPGCSKCRWGAKGCARCR